MKTLIQLALVSVLVFGSMLVHAETIELVTIEYPPYYGKDLKNQGFITEIITTAFSRSGYEVKTKYLPWQRAFDGTKAGKYSAIYTMWYREEREEWFAFSEPLTPNEIGFFKLKEKDLVFKDIADLKPYKIGVVRGYSNPPGFDEAELTLEEVSEDKLNLSKLLRGRIDLVLIDKIAGQHILNTEHSDRKNEVEWLASVEVNPQYLVFSKKAPGYAKKLQDFNIGLKAITDDGTLEKIMSSHGF